MLTYDDVYSLLAKHLLQWVSGGATMCIPQGDHLGCVQFTLFLMFLITIYNNTSDCDGDCVCRGCCGSRSVPLVISHIPAMEEVFLKTVDGRFPKAGDGFRCCGQPLESVSMFRCLSLTV